MQLAWLPATLVITTATCAFRAWLLLTAENETGDVVPTVNAGIATAVPMLTAVVIWMACRPPLASLTVKSMRLGGR